MAINATLNVTLTGSDDLVGNFSSTFPFTFTAQKVKQTIESQIQTSDVDKVVAVPQASTQTLLLVKTDKACSFKVNSETAVHTLADGGVYLITGGATTTQLLFTGGPTTANVLIIALST